MIKYILILFLFCSACSVTKTVDKNFDEPKDKKECCSKK